LLRVGQTALEAASVYEASDNFFNGQGETIQRIDGPPFETATTLIAATSTNTVSWYTGENAATGARQTVQSRVDEATNVSYGVQANEHGLVELMRALSALAVEDYPSGDPNANERFNAMTNTQLQRLANSNNSQPGSIELIQLDLSIAGATTGNTKERHNTYKVQLDTMLADIEHVSNEEVAMELLSLRTRLQASFQATSMISQLTLVNYVR
jgi:flagellin-like hook-associated protein FlgL